VRGRGVANVQGWVQLTVELVPAEEAKAIPAGLGRSEPNQHPTLPKPLGRISFTLNPLRMVLQLLGPTATTKLCCLCTLTALLALIVWSLPVFFANAVAGMLGMLLG